MTDEAKVKITAETGDVAPKINDLKSLIESLRGTVTAAGVDFKTFSDSLQQSLAQGGHSLDEFNAKIKEMSPAQIDELRSHIASLAPVIREQSVQAAEASMRWKEMGESIRGVRESFSHIVEFLAIEKIIEMVKGAIESFIELSKEIAETSEKIGHLSEQLGMSVRSVLELKAAATLSGTSFDTLVRAADQLDKKFSTDPKMFKQLGIEVPKNATQMQLLAAVMDRFSETANGPDKTAAAIALMGRSAAEMIPFLNQGSSALAEMTARGEDLGAVNTDAIDKGKRLAEATNEAKVAYDGLQATIAEALSPALTDLTKDFTELVRQFVDSYESGGTAKEILDSIGVALEGVSEIVKTTASAWSTWASVVDGSTEHADTGFRDMVSGIVSSVRTVEGAWLQMQVSWKQAVDAVLGDIELLKGSWTGMQETVSMELHIIEAVLQTFAAVATDALTLHWGAIQSDWAAGMNNVDQIVRTEGAKIASDAKESRDKALGYFNDIVNAQARLNAFRSGLPVSNPVADGVSGVISMARNTINAMNSKLNAGGGGDIGSLSSGSKGGGGGRGGGSAKPDDRMKDWQEGLQAKRDAIQKEAEDEQSLREMSKAEEAEYWDSIRQMAGLTADERKAVDEKYYAAASAARKSAAADMMADSRRQIQEAQGNSDQQIVIAQHTLAQAIMLYGERSKQAADAQRELTQLEAKGAEDRLKIEEKYFKDVAKLDNEHLADESAKNQFLVEMGVKSEAQVLAEQLKSLQQLKVARDKDYDARIAQTKNEGGDYLALQNLKVAYDSQAQAKITAADRKAILARTQLERQAINSTAQLWGQNISKLLTLQQSFATTIQNLYRGMVGILSDALAQIIEKWLVQHLSALLLGQAASKTAAISQVTSAAGVAGANATASMAAAPFPLDLGAPAFGVSMMGTAMSYLGLASAAGGWFDVPYDGALTELHKNEMVLPAWAAQPLRSMLGGGGANSNAPIAANDGGSTGGGGFHYHDHTARGLTPGQIMANRGAFAEAMKKAHREGKLGFSLPG